MEALSLSIPSLGQHLFAWLNWIERSLPGCIQGCVLSTRMHIALAKQANFDDQRILYANDTVYTESIITSDPISLLDQQLPTTIAGGLDNSRPAPYRHVNTGRPPPVEICVRSGVENRERPSTAAVCATYGLALSELGYFR